MVFYTSRSRSHHTNSFAHIIIKFKNKKVSLFSKIRLFAAASVVNITDISFCYQFESIMWWFGVGKASKWWKIDPTGSPCADCNKAPLKNKVNFFEVAQGRVGREVIIGSNKKNYIRFTPIFYFWYWKRTVWWVKKYIGLFTFFPLKECREVWVYGS